jgi:hypothetical protein
MRENVETLVDVEGLVIMFEFKFDAFSLKKGSTSVCVFYGPMCSSLRHDLPDVDA